LHLAKFGFLGLAAPYAHLLVHHFMLFTLREQVISSEQMVLSSSQCCPPRHPYLGENNPTLAPTVRVSSAFLAGLRAPTAPAKSLKLR
jgi:hypothetical protein